MAVTRLKPEEMNTLIPASQAKAISEIALAELEEMSVAACINASANTGGTEATYAKPISDNLKTKLQEQGYTISSPTPIARPGDVSIISWGDAT